MLPKSWARRLKTQESTQRSLCRSVLVFCAVVPLLGNAIGSLWWSLPWYRTQFVAQIQEQFASQCGTSVRIASARYLSPWQLELNAVEVLHPETGVVICKADRLVAENRGGRWLLETENATVDGRQLASLAPSVHAWFLCRQSPAAHSFRLIADLVRFEDQPNADKKTDTALQPGKIEVQMDWAAAKSSLQLQYQPTEKPSQHVNLRAVRTRETQTPQTSIQLESEELALPLDWVADLLPVVQKFGPQATFAGTAAWLSDTQQQLILRGLIDHAKWETMTDELAYHATGDGTLWLEQVVIAQGKLQLAEGILTGVAGTLSTQWLQKAYELLQLPLRPDALRDPNLLRPYSKFRVHFRMNEAGLEIRGGLKAPQEGTANVLVVDGAGPLMIEAVNTQSSLQGLAAWIAATPDVVFVENGIQQAAYSQQVYSQRLSPVAARLANLLPFPAVQNEPIR